ncbi:MAG: hypothetical protein SGPRY_013139, partial [Prymnesium sp.]
MPDIRQLADQSEPSWITVPMCASKSEFQKWTTLMAAGPAAANLLALNGLPCTHAAHAATAEGEDERGVPLSVRAGEYPTLFSATVAALLDGSRPRHEDLRAVLDGPAAQLLHELNLIQQTANDRAALEFMSELGRGWGSHPQGGIQGEPTGQDGHSSEIVSGWRAAQRQIPEDWREADLLPTLFAAKKSSTLRYVSKRRADAESAE